MQESFSLPCCYQFVLLLMDNHVSIGVATIPVAVMDYHIPQSNCSRLLCGLRADSKPLGMQVSWHTRPCRLWSPSLGTALPNGYTGWQGGAIQRRYPPLSVLSTAPLGGFQCYQYHQQSTTALLPMCLISWAVIECCICCGQRNGVHFWIWLIMYEVYSEVWLTVKN